MLLKREKKIVGFELGESYLKAAEVIRTPRGIEVTNTCHTILSEEIASKSPQEKGQFIADFLKSHGFKVHRVVLVIPRHLAVIKFFQVPKSNNRDEIGQMVRYQAEKELPLSVDEVELNYDIVSTEQDKTTVVLVAIKKEVLKEYIEILEAARIRPVAIDVSAFGTFNVATQLIQDAIKEDKKIIALIDLGIRMSEISIIKEGRLFFTRSASVGNVELARKLEKKFGTTIEKFYKPWRDTLINEITRSFDAFASETGVTKIDKVFICGEGISFPTLPEFLEEKLAIPIEQINSLEIIPHKETVSPVNGYLFSAVIGVAQSYLTGAGLKVNLIKPILPAIKKKPISKKKVLTAAAIFLILLAGIGYFWYLIQEKAAVVHTKETSLNELSPRVEAMQTLEDKIAFFQAWQRDGRSPWIDILRELSIIFPKEVYVESLSISKNQEMKVAGRAHSSAIITEVLSKINNSESFLEAIVGHTRKIEGRNGFDWEFSLRATLVQPGDK